MKSEADRRGKGRAGAGGDKAGQPAVGAKAGVGLAEAEARDGKSGGQRARSGEQRVDRRARKRGRAGRAARGSRRRHSRPASPPAPAGSRRAHRWRCGRAWRWRGLLWGIFRGAARRSRPRPARSCRQARARWRRLRRQESPRPARSLRPALPAIRRPKSSARREEKRLRPLRPRLRSRPRASSDPHPSPTEAGRPSRRPKTRNKTASWVCGAAAPSPRRRNGPSPSTLQGLPAACRTNSFRSQGTRKRRAHKCEDDDGNGNQSQVAQHCLRRRARPAQAGIDERHAGNGQRREQQKPKRERKRGVG